MRIKAFPAQIPVKTGQGFSRKAYQSTRQLGFKGTGTPGLFGHPPGVRSPAPVKHPREYGKGKPKAGKYDESPFNIDYGDTLDISNLGDVPGGLK